jgi:CheY-like chemotaxis protein
MVASTAYDLILMDLQMPRMGGLEATRLIRKLRHGLAVPILAMTGNAFEEDRRECLHAGMNDLIAKPIHVNTLLGALAKWGLAIHPRVVERTSPP